MFDDYNGNFRDDELSGTLTPNVGNIASRSGQKVVLPVLTPDRIEKRQNGRRFKEDGDESYTLTSQDRHGDAVTVDVVGNYSPSGYESARIQNPGGIAPTLKENHGTVNGVPVEIQNGLQDHQKWQKDGNSPTLTAAMGMGGGYTPCVKVGVGLEDNDVKEEHPGMFVQLSNGAVVYAVWYPKYECYVAIRKLTPRECFRLQGWEDEYFERAAFVNSDSQLYKQAGNGVTVNVVEVIGRSLAEIEKENET